MPLSCLSLLFPLIEEKLLDVAKLSASLIPPGLNLIILGSFLLHGEVTSKIGSLGI